MCVCVSVCVWGGVGEVKEEEKAPKYVDDKKYHRYKI